MWSHWYSIILETLCCMYTSIHSRTDVSFDTFLDLWNKYHTVIYFDEIFVSRSGNQVWYTRTHGGISKSIGNLMYSYIFNEVKYFESWIFVFTCFTNLIRMNNLLRVIDRGSIPARYTSGTHAYFHPDPERSRHDSTRPSPWWASTHCVCAAEWWVASWHGYGCYPRPRRWTRLLTQAVGRQPRLNACTNRNNHHQRQLKSVGV